MSDQRQELVDLLPPADGRNVLVFRGGWDLDHDVIAEAICRHYTEAARADGRDAETLASEVVPLVVFLAPGDALELVDADQMADAGWVRHSDPDDLLSKATTALEQRLNDWPGPLYTPDLATYGDCEKLAEAALRGAGVLR